MRNCLVSLVVLAVFILEIALVPILDPLFAAAAGAGNKIKDFRATNQRAALIGLSSEFVDTAIEDKITEQMRRSINRYSRSFSSGSVAGFTVGSNPGKKYFKTVAPETKMDELQKKFLQGVGKDNGFEIVVLGSLREEGTQLTSELQLYDLRTDTASPIQAASYDAKNPTIGIERQVYALMNCMDREGFVSTQPQDFLELPVLLQNESQPSSIGGIPDGQDFAMNPNELGNGTLAGRVAVGGEKTPFWETWWFWSIIGGTLLTAGGLTYYFVILDKSKTSANVTFNLP